MPAFRHTDNPLLRRRSRLKPYRVVNGGVYAYNSIEDYQKFETPEFSRELPLDLVQPKSTKAPWLSLDDIECIRTLGKGQAGQVLLVRTKRTAHVLDKPGSLLAVKAMKRKLIRNNPRHLTEKDRERIALVALDWNPFVCGVLQTFFDDRCLYLALEYIPGGTLRSLIQKHGPFSPAKAAFYYANIVCALAFLETIGLVHRDIKPDNILLGQDGYLCLTDFGNAVDRYDESVSWLNVGTPIYMAPESIDPGHQLSRSPRTAIDWWASGCILFEMCTGKLPFYNKDTFALNMIVLSGVYQWPGNKSYGRNLKDLVEKLLRVQASSRLGSKTHKEVTQHPWLAHINQDKMVDRRYLAPHIPDNIDPKDKWHDQPLPAQREVPGLEIKTPPIHLRYDNRYPPKPVI